MAEFRFYATSKDVEEIFWSLSARGDLSFIPARSYPTGDYMILKSVRTQADRDLFQNRSWYLLGSFTKEPPYVHKVAENHFSVSPQYDGPLLSLTMPPLARTENGFHGLVPGSLSHPRVYWDHAITAARKVPDEVKSAYTSIIKTLKSQLVRRKFDHDLWIGRHAIEQLDAGEAIVLSNGKWWDVQGNRFLKPNVKGDR